MHDEKLAAAQKQAHRDIKKALEAMAEKGEITLKWKWGDEPTINGYEVRYRIEGEFRRRGVTTYGHWNGKMRLVVGHSYRAGRWTLFSRKGEFDLPAVTKLLVEYAEAQRLSDEGEKRRERNRNLAKKLLAVVAKDNGLNEGGLWALGLRESDEGVELRLHRTLTESQLRAYITFAKIHGWMDGEVES